MTKIGLAFHFLNTKNEHPKIAMANQSVDFISLKVCEPINDNSKIDTAEEMINPNELALRQLKTSMIYCDLLCFLKKRYKNTEMVTPEMTHTTVATIAPKIPQT